MKRPKPVVTFLPSERCIQCDRPSRTLYCSDCLPAMTCHHGFERNTENRDIKHRITNRVNRSRFPGREDE